MAVIFIGFDANPAMAMLGALRDKGEDLTPVMAAITEVVVKHVQEGFETGTAPGGKPWKPLKSRQGQIALLSPSVRLAREARPTAGALVDSGRLRGSIGRAVGRDFAEVGVGVGAEAGTAAIYAAIHQFGGKTRARVLKPVNKKALFWPGARHPVSSVKHPGSVIPARPFIPDEQALDWPEAVATPSVGLAQDGSPNGWSALLSPSVRLAEDGSPNGWSIVLPCGSSAAEPQKNSSGLRPGQSKHD